MRITRHFLFKPAVALAVWSWLVPSVFMAAQAAPRAPQGVVSDWTHHHLLFPESTDLSLSARLRDDPRWLQSWYLRHPAAKPLFPAASRKHAHRDWNVSLGTTSFVPQFDSTFTFAISTQTGFGSLNLISQGAGSYLATAGTVTVTGVQDIGTYPLLPGGPAFVTSPNGAFIIDNL